MKIKTRLIDDVRLQDGFRFGYVVVVELTFPGKGCHSLNVTEKKVISFPMKNLIFKKKKMLPENVNCLVNYLEGNKAYNRGNIMTWSKNLKRKKKKLLWNVIGI